MAIKEDEISQENKYQARAIYNSPENFFDWSWPKVPRHQFLYERNHAYDPNGVTKLIELDISQPLEITYPATTPAILARYVKIQAGEKTAWALTVMVHIN